MSLILKQWNDSTVTPKDDAVLYDVATGRQAGIVYGCGMSHVGSNQVRVSEGYLLIRGRLIAVEQEIVNVNLGESGDLGRIKVVMNLASSEPVTWGSDVGQTLPDLQQDENVNYLNGIYELEMATYAAAESTISNLQRTAETVALPMGLIKTVEELQAVTVAGMAVDAMAIKAGFGNVEKSLGGFSFGYTEDGKPGYKEAGADTVHPFKKSGFCIPMWRISSRIGSPNDNLCYDSNRLVLGTEDYSELSFHVTGSITVGRMRLQVYDDDTSAMIYELPTTAGWNNDVSVDISSVSNVRIYIYVDYIGKGWQGEYTITLESITLS